MGRPRYGRRRMRPLVNAPSRIACVRLSNRLATSTNFLAFLCPFAACSGGQLVLQTLVLLPWIPA
eukprot:3290877-Lingulodinium_polyedra.AAC.1